MAQIIKTVGVDPSLTHGCVVLSTFELERNSSRLITSEAIYSWDDKDKSKPKVIDDLYPSLARLGGAIEKAIKEAGHPGLMVGIDWDERAVMWHTRKIAVVKVGWLIGYLTRSLFQYGYIPVPLRPSEVRKQLNISISCDKELVWKVFLKGQKLDAAEKARLTTRPKFKKLERSFSDRLDATVLSWVIAESLRTTLIPSKNG